MNELLTIYKIRRKKYNDYSRGRVEKHRTLTGPTHSVSWKAIGKEWPTEEALKKHLLTCIQKGVDMSGWEIMEFTQQPSKAMNEWFDAKMTFALIKY